MLSETNINTLNYENNVNEIENTNCCKINQETIKENEFLICQKCLDKINKKSKCISCSIIENEKFNEDIKPLLIEKDKLDLFEKNIENASNIKSQIKENINL